MRLRTLFIIVLILFFLTHLGSNTILHSQIGKYSIQNPSSPSGRLGGVSDFKKTQLKYPRVKEAYKYRLQYCKELLAFHGVDIKNFEIYIRILKKEMITELWAKNKMDEQFTHITDYPFCAMSGSPGPKRLNGDMQIPEGFYYINSFEPTSNFYLALNINYPNEADKIASETTLTGGSISIYGECKSNGCVALHKEKMQELYLLAIEATQEGQEKIEVHIFPEVLEPDRLNVLLISYSGNPKLAKFWDNISDGYNYFEKNKKLPKIIVDKNGKYIFLD